MSIQLTYYLVNQSVPLFTRNFYFYSIHGLMCILNSTLNGFRFIYLCNELVAFTVRNTNRYAGTYIHKCTVKRLGQEGIIGYKWQKTRYIYFFDL